jgi:hypothetical protein
MSKILNESFRPSLNAKPLNLLITEFTESEAKDEILRFSIKYLGEFITSSLVSKKVFLKENKEEIMYLMSQMQNEIWEYAEFRENRSDKFIKANNLTKKFFDNGGFSKIEKEELKNEQIRAERESKQDKILDLDLKLKSFESRIGKKLILFAAIISFLSFLITVLTLEFWQTDESKNEQKNQVEIPLSNKKEGIQKDTLN